MLTIWHLMVCVRNYLDAYEKHVFFRITSNVTHSGAGKPASLISFDSYPLAPYMWIERYEPKSPELPNEDETQEQTAAPPPPPPALLLPPPPVPQGPSIRALIPPGIPIHRRPEIVYNQGRGGVFSYLRNRAVAPSIELVCLQLVNFSPPSLPTRFAV